MDEMFQDIAGEWVTYNQAKDRGGNVKKGEHGRKVVFFSMVAKKDEDGNETDKVFPVISWSTVFKVSQCEGI
jgi:antirestriction protein ArdC